MEIFDAHTHFFRREFYEFHTARRPDGTSEILPKRVEDFGSENLPDNAVEYFTRVLDNLDSCGVKRAVTYASVSQEMGTVGEAARVSLGRLVPYASVNPLSTSSMETLRKLQPLFRFRGLVLFPAMHDYPIGGDAAAAAFDFAHANDVVVLIHFGLLRANVRELIGLDPRDHPSYGHPGDLIPVAGDRADQTFIVSHPAFETFEEFIDLGAKCANVHMDTAGSAAWTPVTKKPKMLADRFAAVRNAYGVERILFGSDSGGTPWEYHKDALDNQISAMTEAGYTEKEIAAVLCGNLSKLLRIS
jgi:predicted TIM-barrel fold metal-dependent hydrolase